MLNDTKRKKLGLGAGGGRKRTRRGGGGGRKAAADDVVDLASDDDSDKQLLRQVGPDVRRSTAASLPQPPAAATAARGAGRRGPALDPRTAAMLQQIRETRAHLAALQKEELSDGESEEQPGGCWCCWGAADVKVCCEIEPAFMTRLPSFCPVPSSVSTLCVQALHVLRRSCWTLHAPGSPGNRQQAAACPPCCLQPMPHLPACPLPRSPAEPSPLELRRSGRQRRQSTQQQQNQQQQQQQEAEFDLTADGDGGSPGSQAAADSEVEEGSGGYAPLPPPAAAPAADADRIPLKLRSAKGDKTLRMGRNDPFSRLFEGYRCV